MRFLRLRHASRNEQGFTLPELVTVLVITLLFSGLIMFFTFQYWQVSATLNNDMETFVGRLNAGDRLREALNASSGLIIQNGIADSHAGDPDPAIPSGNYWKPLHAVPGTITMGGSGTITSVLYFKSPSVDSSKNVILNGTQPYEDEFVLYLDGTTKQLRMRVLANSSASSNHAVTTCPSAYVTSSCPIDKLIGENISSVSLQYFSRSGNLINHNSIVDPTTGESIGPDLPVAEVVELTLTVFKKSTIHGGQDTTNTTIIRIALRNS